MTPEAASYRLCSSLYGMPSQARQCFHVRRLVLLDLSFGQPNQNLDRIIFVYQWLDAVLLMPSVCEPPSYCTVFNMHRLSLNLEELGNTFPGVIVESKIALIAI